MKVLATVQAIEALRLAAATLRGIADERRTRVSYRTDLREAARLNDDTADALVLALRKQGVTL